MPSDRLFPVRQRSRPHQGLFSEVALLALTRTMSMTLSGIIFIPLSLVVFLAAPCRLAQLAIVSSVFAAAAVVNSRRKLSCRPLAFFFHRASDRFSCVPGWLNGGFRIALAKPLRRHLQMMVAFAGWAVFSAILFPLLFRGLPVDLARKGADTTYYNRLPLHWSLSNGGQAGYLLLDLVVILYLLQRVRARADLGAICTAFSWSGLIVVAVGAYQWLAHQAGLPFPAALFNSNAVWAQLANQQIGGHFSDQCDFQRVFGRRRFPRGVGIVRVRFGNRFWTIFVASSKLRARRRPDGNRHDLYHWIRDHCDNASR